MPIAILLVEAAKSQRRPKQNYLVSQEPTILYISNMMISNDHLKSPVRLLIVCSLAMLTAIGTLLFLPESAPGQSGNSQSGDLQSSSVESDVSLADQKQQYEDSIEELRGALKGMERAAAMYFHNESSLAQEHQTQWQLEADRAKVAYEDVRKNGIELFLASDKPDDGLTLVAASFSQTAIDRGQLTQCYSLSRKLTELHPDDTGLKSLLGRSAILTDNLEVAKSFASENKSLIDQFPLPERLLYSVLEETTTKFDRELEIRAKEEKADDLPRVELKTTKGKIVLELFENEAPETVANFISLVNEGFYNGNLFHRVVNKFGAHSGFATSLGPRLPPYTIYDEFKKPDARHHFRGTITMVGQYGRENAGSSQFMISLVPNLHLDGGSTVFGRVISGMNVADNLQRTFSVDETSGKEEYIEGTSPDIIQTAKVIRDRGHAYEPNRVEKE